MFFCDVLDIDVWVDIMVDVFLFVFVLVKERYLYFLFGVNLGSFVLDMCLDGNMVV